MSSATVYHHLLHFCVFYFPERRSGTGVKNQTSGTASLKDLDRLMQTRLNDLEKLNKELQQKLDQASALRDFVQEMNMPILQVHGRITVNELARLRGMLPDLVIIKSLVVRDGNDDSLQQTLRKATPYVDAFITDTFDPTTGASGATGKCHDWQISARLVQLSERPVILAGGLHPDNVADAIQMVRPWGVDTHTGVESPDGRKDLTKVAEFVKRAKLALRTTN